VLYHDGETELLNLRNECVIWRLPPNEASEGGEDDVIMEDTLDSDDSIDIMEVEEVTDDMTDDDTPAAARKKGSKRIRRRLRTRKSRVSRDTWQVPVMGGICRLLLGNTQFALGLFVC